MNSIFHNNKQDLLQLIRCAVVGLASNFIGFAFFLLLTHYGTDPKIVVSILYFLNLSIGFWGNFSWVFATRNNVFTVGIKYLISHLLGYSINIMILLIFVDWYGYAYQWVQLGAIAVVAVFLLAVFKLFVFKTPTRVQYGS